MQKKWLSTAFITAFSSSIALAHCHDFVGTWVGLVTHNDPLHVLVCRYKAHATVTPSSVDNPSQVTINYTLDSGMVKKLCKKKVPDATYTIQCSEANDNAITFHRISGKGLTIPPHFNGMVKGGRCHASGKLSGSNVEMTLKPGNGPAPAKLPVLGYSKQG